MDRYTYNLNMKGQRLAGDLFVIVDPSDWKWLKKEEEEELEKQGSEIYSIN